LSKEKQLEKINKKETTKIIFSSYLDRWRSLTDYLEFIYERLLLIKRLLKKDGNLFVHLDWHASHYVKVLLDEVFGYEHFRNEIVWCYTGPSKVKNDFPKKHDIILRYSKSNNPRFYPIRTPYKSGIHDTKGTAMNYSGRKISLEEINRRGKVLEDWWTDIWATERYRKEYLYFDTQKPLRLLERIIKSTTKEGDLIGDFFMGSGTTIIASERLGRKWVGCDNSWVSYTFVNKRLGLLKKEKQKISPFMIYFQEKQKILKEIAFLWERKEDENKSTRQKEHINHKNFHKKQSSSHHFPIVLKTAISPMNIKNNYDLSPNVDVKILEKNDRFLKLEVKNYSVPEFFLSKIKSNKKLGEYDTIQLLEYIKIGFLEKDTIFFNDIRCLELVDNKIILEIENIWKKNKELLILELGDIIGNVLFLGIDL